MRAALLTLLLSGCAVYDALSSSGTAARDGGGGADGGGVTVCTTPPCRQLIAELPATPPTRDLDLLFVVDNSNSMKEEQDALTAALPRFFDVLAAIEGGLPNLHVGVVSTDVGTGYLAESCTPEGDHGLLQNTPRTTCAPPDGRFISDVAGPTGTRMKNYSGTLGDAFACIAKLGIQGCGVEQPLESMRLALGGANAANAGFLRAGSFLAVIILTDEDDCSVSDTRVLDPSTELDNINSVYGPYSSFRCTEFGVTCDGATLPRKAGDYTTCTSRGDSWLHHPSFYVDFLRTLREPTQLFVATIAAPATPFGVQLSAQGTPQLKPACMTAAGRGDPAVRLRDLVALLAGHSAATSICSADLTAPMQEFGRQLSALLSGSCLYGLLLDTAPAAGLQPDCKVTQITGTTRTSLPTCSAGGPQPCFELVADAAVCPYSPGQLRVVVKRPAPAPAGTRYAVECFRP